MSQRYPLLIPGLAATVLLVGALLGRWPYGYYMLLRWVVTGAAIYVAFRGHHLAKAWAIWTFIVVAVLFNPLVPVYLKRSTWLPIDFVVAVLFVIAIFSVRAKRKQPS